MVYDMTSVAIALAEHHGRDLPYCFDRKEVKAYGEGGRLIGAPLRGRVLIIDDVITAGTAVREVMSMIDEHNATAAGVVIGLNRQERGTGELSAIQEVERDYNTEVISIIDVDQVVSYLKSSKQLDYVSKIEAYRNAYGV